MDYRLLSSIHIIHPVFGFRNFECLSLYYKRCSLIDYIVPVFQNYFSQLCSMPVAARSAAARLLGLWVRIPRTKWMSLVSLVCFQVEASASALSLVQGRRTECVCVQWVLLDVTLTPYTRNEETEVVKLNILCMINFI